MKQPFESAKEAASATGDAIAKTAGFFTSTVVNIGKGLFQPLTDMARPSDIPEPGAAPGIEQYLQHEDETITVAITVTDYGEGYSAHRKFEQIEDALAHPKPEHPQSQQDSARAPRRAP